ncbi:polysaccharide deacetylase, partial [Actinobacteria bacterium OK074]
DRTPAHHPLRVVRDHVPTHNKVVFLTYDVTHEDLDTGDLAFGSGQTGASGAHGHAAAGYDRDPRFVTMIRELRLPVSVFLTDGVVGPGYVQAERLRAAGAAVQSRTLDRASLRGLPYEGQRAEICAQRDRLDTRLGLRPTLLRPPHGTYDTATVRAAATCGLTALVTGGTPPDRRSPYTPGQIIDLTGAAPSLTAATTTAVRKAQGEGFAVGRLEDYL